MPVKVFKVLEVFKVFEVFKVLEGDRTPHTNLLKCLTCFRLKVFKVFEV